MKQEHYTQGYFYLIPAALAESGDFYKAMLYGLITSLARREEDEEGNITYKGCDASNEYLAKKLGKKHIGTVSKYVNELKAEGWVEVEVDKNKGNRRRIFPAGSRPITQKRNSPITQERKTSYAETEDPYYVKTEESNITNSNIREYLLSMSDLERERFLETLENNTANGELKEKRDDIDAVTEYYKDKIGSQLKKKPKVSQKAKEKIAIRLRNFSLKDMKDAIDNFSKDNWWMENNAHRGIAWFFKSDERVTQLINLKPRSNEGSKGYNSPNAEVDKWAKFD